MTPFRSIIITASLSMAVANAGMTIPNVRIKPDSIAGVIWYHDSSTTKFNNVNAMYVYVGKQTTVPTLRLRLQYENDKWLFIQKATLVADGHKYLVTGSWQRDHNARVWEWVDLVVEAPQMQMLKQVANAKSVVVRYEGRQYIHDRTIPAKELKAIAHMLQVYKDLGGTL